MAEDISYEQLHLWMLYYRIEPFGEERADARMGIMTSQLVNSVLAAVGAKRFTKPSDFIPDYMRTYQQSGLGKETTPDQWSAFMDRMCAQSKQIGPA